MFASQVAEQKVWTEGFKAGISEAFTDLKAVAQTDSADPDSGFPSAEWLDSVIEKLSRKYQ
jgi:hypothetical protein